MLIEDWSGPLNLGFSLSNFAKITYFPGFKLTFKFESYSKNFNTPSTYSYYLLFNYLDIIIVVLERPSLTF